MAKGYWIGRVDVHDPDTYKNYVAKNAAAFSKYGGRFLVRGGAFEAVKGEARSRNVVIEFPDYETALACWNSPEYQEALAAQAGSATVELIVIEGYDGPQPGA
ncbi:DUF1330 domain-containing protein [Salinarimonas sp.]|uniref:DUF1330 domain-containing protein n=1 Tax=Salinarimonas sp. TaxID=2766526 RepID=UPI003919152B